MMKKLLVLFLFGLTSMAMAADPAAQAATPAASEPAATSGSESEAMAADAKATDAATAETSAATSTADASAEQAGFSRGSVVRSVFTTSVEEREPVDKLSDTTSEQERVFYFTELRDMSGQTAMHRWEKDGSVMAEVKFDVRGPRWRVWSSKTFQPTASGEYKVSVLNGAGEVIAEETLSMTTAPAAESATQTAPTEEPATQTFEPPVNEKLLQ